MNFARPRQRRASEPALPMINVVFLLLIFFLMSAQIAPPAPLAVTPPEARSGVQAEGEHILYLSSDGALAYRDAQGDAAWAALGSVDGAGEAILLLRADAALPATELARALIRASGLGFGEIKLVTAPR